MSRTPIAVLFVCWTGMSAYAASPVERGFLEAHNRLRAGVHVPPLTWSDKLADAADHWARTLLAENAFRHSRGLPYGENLFDVTGAAASPDLVVADWASEVRDYNYRTNQCRDVCGHYTQIVWRGTQRVGCAVARNRSRE
ncbi:MAG: hypothetical protein KGN84_21540, partial [Acidobacteriota bacterium]|nr:hypothetical protein [Acidobacteriota bacterium]